MHTDTIGYKIRLLHNQIHKRMEAKRQENEKEPLTGMQRWTLGFLRDHDGKDIYQKDIETEFSVSRATASNMLAVMERKVALVCGFCNNLYRLRMGLPAFGHSCL